MADSVRVAKTKTRPAPRVGQPRGESIRREDRVDEIIEVASHLFRVRGYRATRLDDISDALGVTRAALYYYFHGKQAILEEAYARAMTSTEQALDEAKVLSDPAERLLSFALTYSKNMSSDAAVIFFREQHALRPEVRKKILARAHAVNAGAEAIFVDGMSSGRFVSDLNISAVARSFLGMLNSLPEWYRESRDGSLQQVTMDIVQTFLRGLLVRPDTAQ